MGRKNAVGTLHLLVFLPLCKLGDYRYEDTKLTSARGSNWRETTRRPALPAARLPHISTPAACDLSALRADGPVVWLRCTFSVAWPVRVRTAANAAPEFRHCAAAAGRRQS